MNVLDENIPEEQRFLLAKWRVPFRQIGFELGQKGLKDPAIIPLLLTLPHPTFFTRDMDFCKRSLCHSRYSLIVMDVDEVETAFSIRRLLHHPRFNTQARRMGTVIRISATGLSVFHLHALTEEHFPWPGIVVRRPVPPSEKIPHRMRLKNSRLWNFQSLCKLQRSDLGETPCSPPTFYPSPR